MKRNKVLYLEVVEQLREDIFSGKYPVGSMLPTETELEEQFGVSKITIRKAIDLLAADEYVEKKSGRGTTVINNRPYNKLAKAASFTQILKQSNKDVKKIFLKVDKVSLNQEEEPFKYFGDNAVLMERLYTLNGKPYIYFRYYLPISFSSITVDTFEKESLYRLLNKQGYFIDTMEDSFSAIFLTSDEKKILSTTDQIAIKRSRKSFDASKSQIVEYSEAIYLSDTHPYLVEYET